MKSRPIANHRRLVRVGALSASAALGLVLVPACSSGSSNSGGSSGHASNPPAAVSSSRTSTSTSRGSGPATAAKAVNWCTLISAADLSQAVGVTYTKIEDNGGLCVVTAATQSGSFVFHVDKEDGALTTWKAQVATIKQDDGSFTAVSGIGDRAVQGAIKEFAAEFKGYIVVVDNADLNSPTTYKNFARSKKVAQALIGKL